MTKEEAIKILESYKQISMSFNLEEDINALDMAIQSLEQTDGDLISRNAVLDLVADYNLSMGQVVKGIHSLPTYSAKKDTAESDGDLISRQAVIDIVEFECGEWKGLAKTIVKEIEQLPSAEQTNTAECEHDYECDKCNDYACEKTNTAEWITKWDEEEREERHYCTNCNKYQLFQTEFCSHCGTKIKGYKE